MKKNRIYYIYHLIIKLKTLKEDVLPIECFHRYSFLGGGGVHPVVLRGYVCAVLEETMCTGFKPKFLVCRTCNSAHIAVSPAPNS